MRTCAALAVGLLLASAALAGPSNYACPADTCTGKCHCGSGTPPGGLAPQDVPQFIVLTNDDSVSVVTYPVIRNITDAHKNRNGCVMPATWFVQTQYSDINLLRELYLDNHEIATHTITHPALPSADEIVGARTWLNEVVGIPLEKIVGFRAPFLQHDPAQRASLYKNGFTYDSSITEQCGPTMASRTCSSRVWPFSMDYGIPIDCTVGTGTCDDSERYPGLWEFPLWSVQDADGSVIASMDPQGDNLEQYKREFERNYNGNRAPIGIYLHAGLLMAFNEHPGQISEFLSWALTHDNVWLVTAAEVIRWIQNPVPASQYQFACPKPTDLRLAPGEKICLEPATDCGQGTWSQTKCMCDCQGQDDLRINGFCLDDKGTCSILKTYDAATSSYSCPASSWVPVTGSSPPSPSAPLGTTPVSFGFYILGTDASSVEAGSDGAAKLCEAVARVALENATNCAVTSVTDVTNGASVTRLQVQVTLYSMKPDNAQLAVSSAAQYGALAASLMSSGLTYNGTVAGTAPGSAGASPSPSGAKPPSSSSSSSGGSSSSNLAVIIGASVGGAVLLAVIAVAAFLVVKRRKNKRRAAGSPTHAAGKVDQRSGSIGPITAVATFREEARSTSFSGSPRSGVTPRHGSRTGTPTRAGSLDGGHASAV